MKYFFVIKRDTLIIVLLTLAVVVGTIGYSRIRTASAYNSEVDERLPIYRVDRGDKHISLTLDAAWGDSDTQELLAIFEEHDVPVTIFVTGDWVTRCAESVEAFYKAGHEIANHSDTHPHMSNLKDADMLKEVTDCNSRISSLLGVQPANLFRAPYGEYTSGMVDLLYNNGIYTIQWDVDSLDWRGLSAEEIEARVMERVKGGSILLFHNEGKHTPAALRRIIPRLKDEGYTFLKTSELIYQDEFYVDHAGVQRKNAK